MTLGSAIEAAEKWQAAMSSAKTEIQRLSSEVSRLTALVGKLSAQLRRNNLTPEV